ncbi:MAG: SufD family Fe-S cluster assembly protein, partial [Pelagibacteraceae bacterium]
SQKCFHEIKWEINHNEENTRSSQFVKSALHEDSVAAFQGKIFVDSKAQKTDGYQLSRALLLSDRSKFLSKPELEIYADDVKCSHGSSSGSIDQEAIFYLRSRGINEQQAKRMMIEGFLAEVVNKVKNKDVRNIFYNKLNEINNA